MGRVRKASQRQESAHAQGEMPPANNKEKQLLEDAKKAEAAAEEHRDTPEKKSASGWTSWRRGRGCLATR